MEHSLIQLSENVPPGEQKGIAYYVKLVLIMGKVVYFSIYLILAARAYYRLHGNSIKSYPFFLVSWFLFIILMIPIYDLAVPHIIKVLYLMMLFSSYGVFLALKYLLKYQDIGSDPHHLSAFKIFEICINIAYIALLIVGFLPGIGALCHSDRTYPYLFIANAVLCVIQSAITLIIYNKGFMRKDYLPLSSSDNQTA